MNKYAYQSYRYCFTCSFFSQSEIFLVVNVIVVIIKYFVENITDTDNSDYFEKKNLGLTKFYNSINIVLGSFLIFMRFFLCCLLIPLEILIMLG